MSSNDSKEFFINLIVRASYVCLLLSTLFLYISVSYVDPSATDSEIWYGLWITVARLFGIAAFAGGVFSMMNQLWFSAVILFLGATVLPIISLAYYGSL